MKKYQPGSEFIDWIERTVHLPMGTAAEPGLIKLPVYLRQIAEAFVAPEVEKISIQKSARIGYSTLLSSLFAWHMTQRPRATLVVLPVEADARNAVVGLEELFDASPDLRGRLANPSLGRSDRNTILFRRGTEGASLRLCGANAPRNLRAVSASLIAIDEADALQDTEGDVVELAAARSLSFKDRRIIIGGTPLLSSTSRVARSFAESDQRIYECRCPSCRGYAELRWPQFTWSPGEPESVRWRCPLCQTLHSEAAKPKMVREGRWRALAPEVKGHRGYRLSSLITPLPHATWVKLVAAFEAAQGADERMKAFSNILLGEAWNEEATEVDEAALSSRAEAFSLDEVPAAVLALTMGVDCQDDRLECVIVGWGRDGTCFVMAHEVIHGSIEDELLWRQLDELLRLRWVHPHGGRLKIDACCVDASDGGHLQHVLSFCRPRSARRCLAIKGAYGFTRPPLVASKSKMRGGGRLWICGVDGIKGRVFEQLRRGTAIRFSDTLSETFYEQLASERVIVRTIAGKPVKRFERLKGRAAEALDGLTYAVAAKRAITLDQAALAQREEQLRKPEPVTPVTPPPTDVPSRRDPWLSPGNKNPWANERTMDGWLDTDRDDWIR